MTVPRTFRFRLKPSATQHVRLRDALERCRQLYNAALEERIDCYRKTGKGLSFFDQNLSLGVIRKERSPYPNSMERAPLRALDQAYRFFFKRGGFPRFKSRDSFKSITWADRTGWKITPGRFYAMGVGRMRLHQHRPLPCKPRSARVKREGRNWFLLIVCDVPTAAPNESGTAIGIDLGISSFAALSDGTLVPNPRHGRKSHAKLKARQRALSRCKRGSRSRRKARERLASAQWSIRRARRTFHYQVAADLVRRFSLIAVEDLNVNGLASGMLARDVRDAAWGGFLRILSDKAESAGVQMVKVDPRHTSQTCPVCGAVEAKKLSQRGHECACGYSADRDVAAAQVILNRAVRGPGADNASGYAERSRGKVAA